MLLPILALACGGSSTPSAQQGPAAPVASAGPDQAVASGATVTLDGSASSAPSGLVLTYLWTQTSGSTVALSSATAQKPTFTAPTVAPGSQPATLVFSLVATDANGPSAPSTVTVTVSPAAPLNPAPVASAGPNQSVASGSTVTLDGSGSKDPDGQAITFAWTQSSGPAVSLSSGTVAQPTFAAPSVGSGLPPVSLTFSLVVTDANASSAPSTVTILVNPSSATCGSGVPPPPPGTPPPATGTPPPVGGNGSHRFQIGTDLSTGGLTVVDPAAGGATVEGFVVVSFISKGNAAPADAVVTLNGVPLTRASFAGSNGLFWQLDPPPAPQPAVGSGGELVLVATATDLDGKQIQRTLVLPCPSDIPVTVAPAPGSLTITPAPGSPLAPSTTVKLQSPDLDLLFNQVVPLFSPYGPKITLRGYDPCTRALGDGASLTGITTASGFNVDVPVNATTSGAYLLDLRWPGPGVIDGQTGGYCQLAKRFFFTK
jgi:hypothetical protein